MPVGAAIGGAAVIGAGASTMAASKAAKATRNASQQASDTALTTAESNNALQREIYGENKATLAPFVGQGTTASQTLASILGLPGAAPQSGDDYASYVRNNPDLLNDWKTNYEGKDGPYSSLADYGKYHFDNYGKVEGRQLAQFTPNAAVTQAQTLRDQMSGPGSAASLINQNLGVGGGAGRVNPYTSQVDSLISAGPQSKAGSAISALLGLGGDKAGADAAFDQYRGSTGYDFRQSEGQKGLTASLGAQGMLNSGSAVRSALKYNQNLGSQEFGNYLGQLGGVLSNDNANYGLKLSALTGQQGFNEGQYNNLMTGLYGQQGYAAGQYQDYLNQLTGQQGVGLNAAGAQAGVATGYANASNANSSNAANVAAQSALAAGNATGNAALAGANGINSALGSAASAYGYSQGVNKFNPALNSSYGAPSAFGGYSSYNALQAAGGGA